jgi:two-component system sensor histidine kinase ResE
VPVELQRGERWLSVSGVSLPGGTVYAFRDLTEERRVERLKSEFVATISHELRTPLAAIYGAALTLRRTEPGLEAQREGLLDVVATESERLARIVNDILWVSRVESGTLHVAVERCDAAALAGTVVAAAQAHLPANLTLTLEVEPEVPPIAADADKLRQVLSNLVDNAVLAMPDGGSIVLSATAPEGNLDLEVADDGPGIPAHLRASVFERFTKSGTSRGSGLGLAIARAIVEAHGGSIRLADEEASGTRIRIELPIGEAGNPERWTRDWRL